MEHRCSKCGKKKDNIHITETDPIIHAPKKRVVEEVEVVIIPEVHPIETVVKRKKIYRHVHHYPEKVIIEEDQEVENVACHDQQRTRRPRQGWDWFL
ncbi:CotD family spore coat protein [Shouchella sp. JSM 1781072]|uniref:CotD family spore coat protein n=1 Tax=Bacillaceae TaxID=186817 RepID=UPI000C085F78|nr:MULTISPECIES: CotD family spore coat protein [Bacillaceae]UTR07432.1 CotD family spore coat protein [Alkalihalobacillus sp. LMS6]